MNGSINSIGDGGQCSGRDLTHLDDSQQEDELNLLFARSLNVFCGGWDDLK
jgi:hypothetical protein